MIVGYKGLHKLIESKTSVQILRLAFATLNCKNYPCKSETRYFRVKRFEVDEAIIKLDDKINSTLLIDKRYKESRQKYKDILISVRDGLK